MKSILIRVLKTIMDMLPRQIKNKFHVFTVFRGWYRKNLNEHYFYSHDFGSLSRQKRYDQWLNLHERGDNNLRITELNPPWLVIVWVAEVCSVSDVTQTLKSLQIQKHACPKVFIVCSEQNHTGIIRLLSDSLIRNIDCQIVDSGNAYSVALTQAHYWVSFLIAGDTLTPLCSEKLFLRVKNKSRLKVVYSDHDYLIDGGDRALPSFKPSWNFDLFLTTNYLSRGGVWSLANSDAYELIRRPCDFESVLWRATLDISESQVGESQIEHIPCVLFSLRKLHEPYSPFGSGTSFFIPLSNYLEHRGARAQIKPGFQACQISWSIPKPEPLVSIIIPTKNAKKLVKVCVESILSKSCYGNYEIVLVDNQSDERSSLLYFEELDKLPNVRVVKYQRPFNYSALNNFAVSQAKGDIIALVNNDIEAISPNWLSEMVSHALRSGVGCVGAKLLFPDDTVQHAGVILGYGGVAGHAHKFFPANHCGYMNRLAAVHNLSAVTAACLVVKKSIYDEVGGLNEVDLKVAFNDVDFCLRVQEAGYRNVFTPHAQLYHHESVTRGSDHSGEKLKRFQSEIEYMKKRWQTHIKPDPAYNPNLTLSREDFSVRSPEEMR